MSDPIMADRDTIVEAMLADVPFDGWTLAVADRAAQNAGLPAGRAREVFGGSAVHLVLHYCDMADRRMVAALAEAGLDTMKIRERIATAVRIRLENHADERECVRRALAVLAMPMNTPYAIRSLYRTVDAMWRAAGDTSTDFNFYTKRASLGWVYSTTLMHWLNDGSEDLASTWAFLDRRIADVMRIPQWRGNIKRAFSMAPNPWHAVRAARTAARNSGFRRRPMV